MHPLHPVKTSSVGRKELGSLRSQFDRRQNENQVFHFGQITKTAAGVVRSVSELDRTRACYHN